jgi:hypothetical protein
MRMLVTTVVSLALAGFLSPGVVSSLKATHSPTRLYYYIIILLRPKKGWSMAEDATLSRRVVMTTRSCCV